MKTIAAVFLTVCLVGGFIVVKAYSAEYVINDGRVKFYKWKVQGVSYFTDAEKDAAVARGSLPSTRTVTAVDISPTATELIHSTVSANGYEFKALHRKNKAKMIVKMLAVEQEFEGLKALKKAGVDVDIRLAKIKGIRNWYIKRYKK